jgi:branched-chain amino acid transport system ATP-binding protein
MLKLADLCVTVSGAELIRNVSMHVPPNAFAALVGRNGAGKTTLMRSVMNILPVASGEIRIAGETTTHAAPFTHAWNGVGYMPEDRRLVGDWTVEDNILLPAWATRRTDLSNRLRDVYTLMPEVAAVADRNAMQLSGGQQKLVALARALLIGNRLLILDEPFEGVAPALAQRLSEILAGLRRQFDMSVLISESDLIHSRDLVDRVFVIERGTLRSGF